MMSKYIYKNKINGAKVYSDKPLNHVNLELINQIKDTSIKICQQKDIQQRLK